MTEILLDLERVLLAMVAGAIVFMVAAVRPNLPAHGGLQLAGAVWRRFAAGAMAAGGAVAVPAGIRLVSGDTGALVHLVGAAALLALVAVKRGLDLRIDDLLDRVGPAAAYDPAVRRIIGATIPVTVGMLLLCLSLAALPA